VEPRFLDEKIDACANVQRCALPTLSNEIDIESKKDRDHHSRCRPRTALMDGVDSRRVIARSHERRPQR
jgi:hypothetical protein